MSSELGEADVAVRDSLQADVVSCDLRFRRCLQALRDCARRLFDILPILLSPEELWRVKSAHHDLVAGLEGLDSLGASLLQEERFGAFWDTVSSSVNESAAIGTERRRVLRDRIRATRARNDALRKSIEVLNKERRYAQRFSSALRDGCTSKLKAALDGLVDVVDREGIRDPGGVGSIATDLEDPTSCLSIAPVHLFWDATVMGTHARMIVEQALLPSDASTWIPTIRAKIASIFYPDANLDIAEVESAIAARRLSYEAEMEPFTRLIDEMKHQRRDTATVHVNDSPHKWNRFYIESMEDKRGDGNSPPRLFFSKRHAPIVAANGEKCATNVPSPRGELVPTSETAAERLRPPTHPSLSRVRTQMGYLGSTSFLMQEKERLSGVLQRLRQQSRKEYVARAFLIMEDQSLKLEGRVSLHIATAVRPR